MRRRGSRVVIANPDPSTGGDNALVSDMWPAEAQFSRAMLFGVMMSIEPAPLVGLLRDVRQRLRGGGILLVAEPDPEGVVGRAELAAKRVHAAIRSLWNPTLFTIHSDIATRRMLREAGFVTITDLTPNAMGVKPPPMSRYFVIAAGM